MPDVKLIYSLSDGVGEDCGNCQPVDAPEEDTLMCQNNIMWELLQPEEETYCLTWRTDDGSQLSRTMQVGKTSRCCFVLSLMPLLVAKGDTTVPSTLLLKILKPARQIQASSRLHNLWKPYSDLHLPSPQHRYTSATFLSMNLVNPNYHHEAQTYSILPSSSPHP